MISILAPARGATGMKNIIAMWQYISILAPARGATRSGEEEAKEYYISILAPARGATQAYLFTLGVDTDFNPRSREGSDKGYME